jgi:hypothetical protein
MKPFRSLPATEDPSILSAWLCEQASRLPDHRLYALLDGGQLEGLPYKLKSMAPDAFGTLFGALGKTDLEKAGGWLLEISGDHPQRWDWVCQEALRQPSVLWLRSPLRLPELLGLLAPRMDAKLARGPEVYLRFYDRRVFTNLIEVLKLDQAPFLSMASHWFWLDHAFQRCTLEIPLDLQAARAFRLPLEIDAAQEKALIDSSLPYEVMAILHSEAPEVLEAIPGNARYDLLRQGVEGARAQGAHRLSDLVGFCLAFLDPLRGASPAR